MHYHVSFGRDDDDPICVGFQLTTNDERTAAAWLNSQLIQLGPKDEKFWEFEAKYTELRAFLDDADFPANWEEKCGNFILRCSTWSADWCELNNGGRYFTCYGAEMKDRKSVDPSGYFYTKPEAKRQ